MKHGLFALLFVAAVGLALPAAAHDFTLGDLTVSHPWARASAGRAKNGVAFMTLANNGQATDRLVKLSTPVAMKTSLHLSVMEGGLMHMRPVEAVEVTPGESTVLKPGGLHVMLMGLKAPLKKGKIFTLTLTFEKAGSVDVAVEVQGPGTMAPGHEHGDD
jgi:hypothetical protein